MYIFLCDNALVRVAELQIFFWGEVGKLLKRLYEMTLICIVVFKSNVGKMFELPSIDLLKSRIKLGDSAILIRRDADILLKHSLKSPLRNAKFVLNFC